MEYYHLDGEIDLEAIKSEAEAFYGAVGEVWCPYFQEVILFNAEGLRHLKFKSDKQARSIAEQYVRFKLLRFAPKIIRSSSTIQGIERTIRGIIFYEFIAVIEEVRVKVILRENIGGKKQFWSVIPFWKVNKSDDIRILNSGNMDVD